MGKVAMSGIVPKLVKPVPPPKGIPAGDLAVGNSVFLKVNGVLTEFLIVNKGIPGNSSLYDASCDGVWLLMKDVYENRAYNTSNDPLYYNSQLHSYLNSTFLSLLDANVIDLIHQAVLPIAQNSSNKYIIGMSAKIFLLSGTEVGWTNQYMAVEGAKLDYFVADYAGNSTRAAYMDGVSSGWSLRSANSDDRHWGVFSATQNSNYPAGYVSFNHVPSYAYGVRPALIVPHNVLFDEETMELIGVA